MATRGSKKQDSSAFPIVGIGASAGGLEAIEQFLGHVPTGSGMAFVIVQHLDPTQKGMMVELLSRAVPMKVVQVKDRMRVEPNGVYVIPPNQDMSILHGVLHLLAPAAPRGLRLPIDYFLRALADDQHSGGIGVILSGMGSDGTLGARAIKERAGVVLAQAPASAKFDAMPRSVIEAGLADIVAPAEELAGKLAAYLAHVPLVQVPNQPLTDKTQSGIEKVCVLLRSQTGHDFSSYKRSTVYRRIERRMGLHQLDGIADYVRLLRESTQETQILFHELLIGVTNFFRDPAVWECLRKKVFPKMLAARGGGGVLRAWVAGCSTGEEAYSLAMIFKEALAQLKPDPAFSLQIFATDLDSTAIERARQGLFPASIAADVSAERLRQFFVREERGYQVRKEIREMVIFAPQNLVMDPPFTRLDILCCRNLLIYLAPELQKKLLSLFHYSLGAGGALVLGSAETIGNATDLFRPLDAKTRIFQRLDSAQRSAPIDFPAALSPRRTLTTEDPQKPGTVKTAPNLQTMIEQILLQRFAPAAVLTSDQGDILFISGRTGKYLEPAAGKANWNIYAMAREELRYELVSAFQMALKSKRTVTQPHLRLTSERGVQTVEITVEPILDVEALRGTVLVVFTEVVSPVVEPPGKSKRIAAPPAALERREQELRLAREELRSMSEQMQTSREELRSANEELQSTNEELQSTNEELTTSKEEMQSMNEELQTLNHELQTKVDELSRTNNDMRNLLDSTDIATLFLDQDLNVRRYTPQMVKIIKLIPSDLGRPISDLATELIYPDIVDDAHEVLRTLVFKEQSIATRDGRWFSVRIMPYRTLDNRIDGVVITLVDITAAKTLEASLRKAL
jgi:two-component system CheB/CheR fusion protein